MCKYCGGETVKERVEYTTKAERKAHGGSWFGYKTYIEHPHFLMLIMFVLTEMFGFANLKPNMTDK